MTKRILLFIPGLAAGGAERVCVNMANYWSAADHSVSVVTLSQPTTDFHALSPLVERYTLGLLGESRYLHQAVARNLRLTLGLRRLLALIHPDVVISFLTQPNVVLALARRGRDEMIAIGTEHVYPPMFPLPAIWERLRKTCYRYLDAVSTLTVTSASWIRHHTNARHIVIIPNPIMYPLLDQPPSIPPFSIGRPDRKRILAAGRLTYQKGFDMLISSFHQLFARYSDWELVILGDGPLRSSLKHMVEQLCLDNAVYLPGTAGNLADWFASSHLFAFSSRFEGFGNVIVEAMNYGLPVVSFACKSGPEDIIRHEVDGLLVPPEDIRAFSAALERLMRDDSLRKRMATRAIESRERFAISSVMNRWEQLIDELRARKNRGL